VQQRLGVKSLPAPVADLIREKAEGHPFFSEELAYALRDAHFIHCEQGECAVAAGVDLRAVAFSDTVQGVITSRIDRLPPQTQITLKVASVVGRVFAYRILRDIHPIEADKQQLPHHLRQLEQLDLTPLNTPEPDLAYVFKHILTQEVAYNLMLFAQRRSLHRAVAQWYERTYATDLAPFYPVLAHHWIGAEDWTNAVAYLEKAGEQALRRGAYREAGGSFTEVLRRAGRGDYATSACRQLRRYTRVFLIGQPRRWVRQGTHAWLAHKPARAQRAWAKGLTAAQNLQMPYDEGLAHYEIGRHAPQAERHAHLQKAAEIFASLGARYDAEQAKSELQKPSPWR